MVYGRWFIIAVGALVSISVVALGYRWYRTLITVHTVDTIDDVRLSDEGIAACKALCFSEAIVGLPIVNIVGPIVTATTCYAGLGSAKVRYKLANPVCRINGSMLLSNGAMTPLSWWTESIIDSVPVIHSAQALQEHQSKKMQSYAPYLPYLLGQLDIRSYTLWWHHPLAIELYDHDRQTSIWMSVQQDFSADVLAKYIQWRDARGPGRYDLRCSKRWAYSGLGKSKKGNNTVRGQRV